MTNTRRAVLALSLGVLLLIAAGILLQVHFWRMIILLGLFFLLKHLSSGTLEVSLSRRSVAGKALNSSGFISNA